MAHFFPSNILDNVLNQLELPIFQNNKLNFLQRNQFRHLRSKLELFKCVIDEAEPMAVLFPDIVGKWVRDLYNMLHEIDDLLDEIVTRSMPSSGMLGKVGLRLYRLPFDLTVAPKVKSFNKRLQGIVNECCKCNLLVQPAPCSSNVGGGTKKLVARRGILRYHPDHCMKDDGELHMIGRDYDKRKVISMLFNEDITIAPVVCITGEVGVGKTTLGSAIYNDTEVENHFSSQLWVDFDQDVFDLIERQKIVSLIERKEKTLIVLDCVSPDSSALREFSWRDLVHLVDESRNWSKILLIWNDYNDQYLHHSLRDDLSEEHCWSIFESTAFAQSSDKKQWMIDLGEKIVEKCPRNPALLKAVGTLLYQNNDKALWDHFSRDFDFNRQHQHYKQIARASRSFLKCEQVVAYLQLFCEIEFTFTTLIDQCVALGFTNLSSAMQQKLRNSFFLLEKQKEDQWDDASAFAIPNDNEARHIITCIAGSEAIFLGSSMDIGHGEEVRHVAIDRPSSSSTQQRDIRLPHGLINGAVYKIRSLLFPKELCPVRISVETLDMLASKLLNLRVLDLHDLALKALPSSFEKLIHLRYVDLSRNEFKNLPKSICKLKNLQILKLVYCDKLVKLPQCIRSLGHLKQLELRMCFDLTHLPPAIAEMTSLERLDKFVVGPYNGGLRYLKNLNNLRGHLCIELPRRWGKSTEDAEQANLKGKDGLTSVKFKWNGAHSGDDENGNNDVLDKLEPCTNVDSLFIINFGGTKFPDWITQFGMESRLTNIAISHCRGCKILPPFHKMPKLELLTLTSMDIEYLQDDINRGNASFCIEPSAHGTMFFPSLLELKIGRMPKLIRWSRDMSELLRFSHIQIVEIWDCPHLTMMPPFSTLNYPLFLQNVSKNLLQAIDSDKSSTVEIVSIPNMVSLPDEFVSKLPEYLEVKDCNEWQMFWANDGEQTPTTLRSVSDGFQRLHELQIVNCPAMKYMSSSLRRLTNLEYLVICKCSEELDCLHEEDEDGMPWKALKNLTRLKIRGFEKLVTLPKSLQHIPYLYDLRIVDCKSLRKCFHFSESNEAEVRCPIEEAHWFRLSIENCPEMKYLSSSLRHLVGLQSLEISKCSEELDCLYKEEEDGMPWKALGKLGYLKIEGFENLVALPKGLQHLRSLWKLEIRECKSLRKCFYYSESNEAEVHCPIEDTGEIKMLLDTSVHSSRAFRGLEALSIVNCPEVKYLSSSLRRLDGLIELEISKCSEELDCLYKEEEDGMHWKALRQLRRLKIEGFENLVALPKGLQHLRKLYRLEIRDCKTLEGGVPALPKLEVLDIKSCPRFSAECIRDEHADLWVDEEWEDEEWVDEEWEDEEWEDGE